MNKNMFETICDRVLCVLIFVGSSPGQKQTQSVQSMASVGSVQSMASEASVQSMASEASLASIQSEASVQSMASEASVQSMASEASLQGGDDEEDERLAKARKFYKAPKQSKNLVFYFYAKEGEAQGMTMIEALLNNDCCLIVCGHRSTILFNFNEGE